MRKFGKVLIYVVVCFFVAGVLAVVATGYQSNQSYDKTIVYLGDSICEGILGSSPFSERDSNCYYAIVGRRNNYRYVDRSVSGDTAKLMYNRLTSDNSVDKERQYWVSQADIVHISILGNDLLGGDIGQTAIYALQNDYEDIDLKLNQAAGYFAQSIQRIQELNPDVLILVNTLYNPLAPQTTLLTQEQKDEFMQIAEDPSQIRIVGARLVGRLNKIIYDYLDDHPNAYEIIDAYTAFDERYTEEFCGHLIYGDWLHPSNEGHAVIANLIQEKLEEKGLADPQKAVSRDKAMRIEQLERLYADTSLDIASIKSSISSAKSCQQISETYLSAVRGVTPIYINKPISVRKGKLFKEDKIFKLSSIKMDSKELSTFFNKDKCYVEYRKDGTFSIKLVPSNFLTLTANIFLMSQENDIDLSNMGPIGFGTDLETYLKGVFPGFDLRKIKESIELLTSIGLYIDGLDYDSPAMKELMDSMEMNLVIPKTFALPNNISFEIKGYYFIEQVGEFTNINMAVGNVSQNGYPFLFSILHTQEDGSQWIETSIEVSKITLYAEN